MFSILTSVTVPPSLLNILLKHSVCNMCAGWPRRNSIVVVSLSVEIALSRREIDDTCVRGIFKTMVAKDERCESGPTEDEKVEREHECEPKIRASGKEWNKHFFRPRKRYKKTIKRSKLFRQTAQRRSASTFWRQILLQTFEGGDENEERVLSFINLRWSLPPPSTMLDFKRGFASATTFGSSEALNSGILSLSKKSRPAFLEGIAFYDIVVGPRNQSVERRSTELVETLKPRPGKGRIHATLSKSLGGESRYG